MNKTRRRLLLAIIVLASWTVLSCSSEESVFFDIPAGPASHALDAFASQSSLEIIYNVEEVAPITTDRVYGNFTNEKALQLLLEGTGLEYAMDGKSGAIAVWKRNGKSLN